MATPVGHGLVGVAAYLLVRGGAPSRSGGVALLAACVVLANLPDLDLLFPILLGEGLNPAYHRAATHTGAFALLVGALCAVGALIRRPCEARRGVLIGLGAFGLVASHLALDLLTHDNRAPYGVPLWWPLDGAYVIAGWTPFLPTRHGSLSALLSAGNLMAVVWDALLMSPIVLACYLWSRRGRA
ncbi:MAG: metal-dependent hydrolase [Nitrospirae bacterium]|nr:metal-dependent hydrolase [Nitrospirota bacterium]